MKFPLPLFLFLSLALAGCSNSISPYYKDLTRGMNTPDSPRFQAPGPEPELVIKCGSEAKKKERALLQAGMEPVGRVRFARSRCNSQSVLEQARKVNADTVAYCSRYLGSATETYSFTVQEPVTRYKTGEVTYSGTSYNAGSNYEDVLEDETRYDTITRDKCEIQATFYRKRKSFVFGAYFEDLSDEATREIQSNQGAEITLLVKRTPAWAADILSGDVITHINDFKVLDSEFLLKQLKLNQGRQINLSIFRQGKTVEIPVQLNPM